MVENNQFTLVFKQDESVQHRVYSLYEDKELVLRTTRADELNGLTLSRDANVNLNIEPEVKGLKWMLLLVLQLLASSMDSTFFPSFLSDSIELEQYPFEQLELTYRYSFTESFRSASDYPYVQRKEIHAKRFFALFALVFVPISILLVFCMFVLMLGTGNLFLRILIFMLLGGLEWYLCSLLYRLSRFIGKGSL